MRTALVAALLATGLAAAPAAAPAAAADAPAEQAVSEIIVAYEPGAVAAADAGRDIGFGMRVVPLPDAVDEAVADRIAATMDAQPGVRFAVPNAVVTLADTQSTPTWGLDRIDERALAMDSAYAYGATGAGVTAYVIDTGLRSTHVEFTGRVGAGFVADGIATVDAPGTTDCNGHGTHVAGTIAGTTYGVAKKATVVPVRVFGCSGTTTLAALISGIDWVVGNHVSGPAVANMSLTSGADVALDYAVSQMIADGITVVGAAGNDNGADSCLYSPARIPAVITVNASDSSDLAASFSNRGACSDLYAPGVSITSAWITTDTDTATGSGTSMAAPHVAGVAARLLERDPSLTPAQVATMITSLATPVTFAPAAPDPDLLLFAPAPPTTPQSVTANAVSTSIELTWQAPSAPAADGGSAVTEYRATAWSASSDGTAVGTCRPSPMTATTCTISGLDGGSTYYVDVAAFNAVSPNASSAPRIDVALSPSAPSAPRSVTATAGDATAAVAWQAPALLGGSSITAYEVTAWSATSAGTQVAICQPATVDARTCTLTGLVNGTTYYVDVTATNGTGTGPASSPRIAVTPVAPAPPPASGGGGGSSGSGDTSGGGGGGSIWTVVEVRPAFGSTAGGDTILVLGWGFTGATGVSVGGTLAPAFRFINDGTLEIVTPPGSAGWQELRVWLPNGSVPAMFEYRTPTVTPAAEVPAAEPPVTASSPPTPAVRILRTAPTPSARRAPAVTAPAGTALRIRVGGLPERTWVTARVRVDGRYVTLGRVRTTAAGAALLPAFTAPQSGSYLIRLSPARAKPLYLKAVIR